MLNPWYFNFVERNDMQLEQLQEEKLLLKITGGSWKFSQGFKLWENMENILRQIASELVCTHSPLTFMHLPITLCWLVINVTILIQEFLCHTTWDGEGFWEVFCIRQVMQNPQVLGGGGGSDQECWVFWSLWVPTCCCYVHHNGKKDLINVLSLIIVKSVMVSYHLFT